jgi:hypothetical protein
MIIFSYSSRTSNLCNSYSFSLGLSRWLFSIYIQKRSSDPQNIFDLSPPVRNHLNVAKWLYQLGNVNIHLLEDEAFRKACKSAGSLEIVMWLYKLGNINKLIN